MPTYGTNDWLNGDTYDNNGNTTASLSAAYQYDVENRLVNVNSGGILITYDGDGNRVKKTMGTTTTYYLVDDLNPTGYAQVVEEHQSISGGAATLTAVYTHGLDLIAQRRSGNLSYFCYDGHGSTRLLTDASGNITDTYLFDAYGTKLSASTGTTPNNYLYCGEQFDSDIGLYYFRARYYKPDTGRFWTSDPYAGKNRAPLSLHKYLYCANDPVNRIDPSGLFGIDSLLASFPITASLAGQLGLASVSGTLTCGPDVTTATINTLLQIETTWKSSWSPMQKKTACAALQGSQAHGAWYIEELARLGYGMLDYPDGRPMFPSVTGTSPWCKRTVVFDGKCHAAGDVNYIMWGKINSLCYLEFEMNRDADDPRPPVHSPLVAKALVRAWKYYWHITEGDPLNYLDGALGFTDSGYSGRYGSPNKNVFSHCSITGNKCSQNQFRWQWYPHQRLMSPIPKY